MPITSLRCLCRRGNATLHGLSGVWACLCARARSSCPLFIDCPLVLYFVGVGLSCCGVSPPFALLFC